MDFIDLKAQQKRIRSQLDQAISKVLDEGRYILGPEVHTLEEQLSEFCGAKHSIGCASGTDALLMAMMTLNIGPGDVVFVPDFTFPATPEVIVLLGAIPMFVDVRPDTFNLCAESLKSSLAHCKKEGLNAKAIVVVDLYGQPADYDAIHAIAKENDLYIIDDAAQSFGARYKDKNIGQLADITTTSFFPAKPLGCYGDGGGIFTDNDEWNEILRSIRVHGQGKRRFDSARIGVNGRLDTLQAAILIEKLKIFPEEIELRAQVAARYNEGLKHVATTPVLLPDVTSTYAQYTLLTDQRDHLMAALKDAGIPSGVYYPIPVHQQQAYAKFLSDPKGLPVTQTLCEQAMSLPMHPYLTEADQHKIIDVITTCLSHEKSAIA